MRISDWSSDVCSSDLPEGAVGSHVAGYNGSAIGVVYIGGVDRDGHPKDTRTPEQKDALKHLLRRLKAKYKGAIDGTALVVTKTASKKGKKGPEMKAQTGEKLAMVKEAAADGAAGDGALKNGAEE